MQIYCIICGKYRKFKNPKISYIFDYWFAEIKMEENLKKKNQLRY